MAIKINTGMITHTADQIDSLNRKIRNDYVMVSSDMKRLHLNWSGDAASSCFTTNEDIKRNYVDPRYEVIAGFTTFLRNQVGVNYEVTEMVLTTAASAFK